MKLPKSWMLAATLGLSVFACKENTPDPVVDNREKDDQGRVVLQGDIAENTTLLSNEKYILRGFVYVKDGYTLTIEPGTVIFGEKSTAGTLVIERGAKIDARGTQQRPIIFTSAQPAGQRNYGDWGGIVLVGKAPVNRPEGTRLEGGIAGGFGGSDANDNSGVMQYVRIEFPGVPLTTADNSEVNGLTLYGVGAGTTLDHIQVSYSGDDSYEWFGGTANAKYLVAYRGFDDDFDTDFGFTGKVQFGLSLRDPQVADQSGSNGFESDNFAGTGEPATAPGNGLPLTEPIFANISIFANNQTPVSTKTPSGSGPYQSAMHLRRNTATSVFNSVIVGYPEGLRLSDPGTLANIAADKLQLRGIVLANVNTPARGTNNATDAQAQALLTNAAGQNQVVALADLATLGLNANVFNLSGPSFVPTAGASIATGAVWTGKGADAFFEKVPYRGAFGTTNWTEGWTNFNPQQAQY